MVYNLTNSAGAPLVSIPDGTVNTTATSLTLPGFKASSVGQALDQNLIYLIQNFAFTSPPPNPLFGQLWYDTVSNVLNVYTTNNAWSIVTPPFDGASGTATVIADNNNTDVVVIIAENKIVSVVCQSTILPAALVDQVIISDQSYAFSSLFPDGLFPGVNLPVSSNNYQFIGTATKANVLTNSVQISLSGDVSGNVMFNGGSNVNIVTTINTTPMVILEGDVHGNSTVINGNVVISSNLSPNGSTAGSYNNVTIDATGRVTSGYVEYQTPLGGIILWPLGGSLIPSNYALCAGQTIDIIGLGNVVAPNLGNVTVGGASYIMRVY